MIDLNNTTPLSLRQRTLLVLLAVAVFSPYFAINLLTASWPAHDLSTAPDRWIPFSPAWELIYVSIYFYIFIPVVYIKDALVFRRAVAGFCLMQVICYGFFLAMPAGLERPALGDINTQFLHWGVALNWILDQPRNLFPSLHLANAFMVSLLLMRADRQMGLPALLWACLIGYSTLAVKHHLLADVISGIALAVAVDWLLFRPVMRQPLPPEGLYPRRRLLELLLLYPGAIIVIFALWLMGWRPFEWP